MGIGPSLSIRPTEGHPDSFGEWPGLSEQDCSNPRNSPSYLEDGAKSQPTLLCYKWHAIWPKFTVLYYN